ncbi:alpha/beta hydrolase [Paenibacillus sp. GbtcB18]|uniref:alpha/beta hydrolase n=1 Tax=Paenibacillus sp. GbtcB18 TaxID=2824763 RepID=UPI0020C62565|nr:alpha/beta fold hydrolase [Paenibacillus sp. GbtcB18]
MKRAPYQTSGEGIHPVMERGAEHGENLSEECSTNSAARNLGHGTAHGDRRVAEHNAEQRAKQRAKHSTPIDTAFVLQPGKYNERPRAYSKKSGSILWLSGWSMPPAVFDDIRQELPEFRHFYADYGSAESPGAITESVRRLALSLRTGAPHGEPSSEPHESSAPAPLLIAGWSLGGLLALRLASEGLAAGLVLFGATARFVRQPAEQQSGWAPASVQAMIPALRQDADRVLHQFRRQMFTKEERRDGLGAGLPEASGWSVPGLIAGLELLVSEDVRDELPDIHCPALLIHGTHDKICPYGAALEIQAGVPQAVLVEAAGCGHGPFLQKERQTAETIRSWWNDSSERQNPAPV